MNCGSKLDKSARFCRFCGKLISLEEPSLILSDIELKEKILNEVSEKYESEMRSRHEAEQLARAEAQAKAEADARTRAETQAKGKRQMR